MSTSPAQQCFRDFKKECNVTRKLTAQALLSGESYTYENVVWLFEPVLEQFNDCLSEIPNVDEKWKGRAEEYALFTISKIVSTYTEKKEEGSTNTKESIGNFEPDKILGFPVITHSDCLASGSRVRGQILLTIDELAEYIAPIPLSVINGVVLVSGENGDTVGFSICAQKTS